MKHSRKVWSTILAASMLAAMAMTGCGGNNEESTVSVDTSDLYTEAGTYFPIVNEPITLTVFTEQRANTVDYNTNDVTVFLEENTGIDLNFETAPSDALEEKVNLAFASQDLPDMFLGVQLDDSRYGVEEGQLIDLTELIDTKMPRLQEIFEEVPTMRGAMTQTDGKIYQFPAFNDCYHCNYAIKMWANTAHLGEMGVEAPTTIEEFYNVCKQFKEMYPDSVPLAGAAATANGGWNSDPMMFILNAYTFYPDNVYGLRMHGDTVETAYSTDEYREALKFLNQMYNEGLLYEATYTTTADQMKSILVEEGEPVLFFSQGASVNFIDSASTPELYSHYYPIAPLEGPDGTQMATHIPTEHYGYYSITTECQYPEAAARLVDYLLTDEGGFTMNNGPEGTGWEYVDESESWIAANGEPATIMAYHVYTQEPQNECWQDVVGYASSAFRFASGVYQEGDEPELFAPEASEMVLYQATHDLYEPYKTDEWTKVPALNFLVEENTSVQTIEVELETYISESKVQFITGVLDINDDAAWQSYVESLDSIGMPKLIEVYQTAYDRQYK